MLRRRCGFLVDRATGGVAVAYALGVGPREAKGLERRGGPGRHSALAWDAREDVALRPSLGGTLAFSSKLAGCPPAQRTGGAGRGRQGCCAWGAPSAGGGGCCRGSARRAAGLAVWCVWFTVDAERSSPVGPLSWALRAPVQGLKCLPWAHGRFLLDTRGRLSSRAPCPVEGRRKAPAGASRAGAGGLPVTCKHRHTCGLAAPPCPSTRPPCRPTGKSAF